MENLARILVVLGLVLIVAGGLVYLAARLNLPLGRLPGDIRIQTGNVTCFFPLATMILLSILLTVGLNLIIRLLNK
jgi:hypothetical protein